MDLSAFYNQAGSYQAYIALAYGTGWALFASLAGYILWSWVNIKRRAQYLDNDEEDYTNMNGVFKSNETDRELST